MYLLDLKSLYCKRRETTIGFYNKLKYLKILQCSYQSF